jgi:hypothetical protein
LAPVTFDRGCFTSFQVTARIGTITPILKLFGFFPVKGLKGEERPIRKNEVLFLEAKDYYQITNNGTEPLVLFGNRSEAFGGPHMKVDGTDRNAGA